MAGQIVGAIVFTSLSDRYGRKPVYVSTYMFFFILSLATAFVPFFAMFAVLRFILGALNEVNMYVYYNEIPYVEIISSCIEEI